MLSEWYWGARDKHANESKRVIIALPELLNEYFTQALDQILSDEHAGVLPLEKQDF